MRWLVRISRFFGEHRTFVRRVAALALILIGVHRAADIFNELAFNILDTFDLWVDHAVWSSLDWLAGLGAFPATDAVTMATDFSEWVDLDEKDVGAKWVALFLELFTDLLLLKFAWGSRPDLSHHTLLGEFRESIVQLRRAAWPPDLERMAVPIVLFCFAVKGALFAGIAVEALLQAALTEQVREFNAAPNVSAFVGIATAGFLLWRFLPDLLHGGLVKAGERADAFAEKQAEKLAEASTRWKRFRILWRRVTRGAFIGLVVVPVAVVGLVSHSVFLQLLARVGMAPS